MLSKTAVIDHLAEDLYDSLVIALDNQAKKARQRDDWEIPEEAVIKMAKNLAKLTLEGTAGLAAAQLEAGEDFTVPGIVKLGYTYRAPKRKGERWKKGETRINNVTKEESVAEEDSPVVKAGIKLRLSAMGGVLKLKPGSKPEAQAAFLATPTAKAVIKRKAAK